MTSFDSASLRLEKSLDRLESAVAARVSRVEEAAAKKSQAVANDASAAEARVASLAGANEDVTRRLDETIVRITRLLEG